MLSSSFFDGSPFFLDAVSDRFEVVLRRYRLFVKETPRRFEQWLSTAPSQKRVFASLDSICTELFPDLLSIVSTEFPQRWMLPVACVALKHYVWTRKEEKAASSAVVELSDCGRALRVAARGEDVAMDRPPHRHEEGVDQSASLGPLHLITDAVCAASRTAALEVRVAELECRSQGLLPNSTSRDDLRRPGTADGDDRKRKRSNSSSQRQRRLKDATGGGDEKAKNPLLEDDETVEGALVYINECRAEALDALAALRKVRHRSRRQAAQLDAAHMELSRLKAQIESLQKKQPIPAVLLTTSYILPKRALSLAGFWNLDPNDLLRITPILIETVGQRGGTIVRREGMQPCFASSERELVVETAEQVMARYMPHHTRRQADQIDV